jgi:hypothetical protein
MGEDARVGLILLLTLRSDASACVAHAQEVPMSTTLVQTRPTTLSTISPDLAGVGLFSLLGLTLSAAVLSYVSSETISLMFSSIG